jgi:hypothetical protein
LGDIRDLLGNTHQRTPIPSRSSSWLVFRRERQVLRRTSANIVPRRFGADENVHFDSDTGISVDAAKGHSMHFS